MASADTGRGEDTAASTAATVVTEATAVTADMATRTVMAVSELTPSTNCCDIRQNAALV